MKPLSKFYYVGVFFIALSTLLLEILLTRIFSALMWYHFAFLAISIALFGLTVGATIVFLFPGFFPETKVALRTAQGSFLFSLSTVVCVFIYINLPTESLFHSPSLLFLTFSYLLFSIPFLFSGISICLALTTFPSRVHSLYASDLMGAGLGCSAVIFILRFTDGPTSLIITSFLAAISALFFIAPTSSTMKKPLTIYVTVFSLITLVMVVFSHMDIPLIRFDTYKGNPLEDTSFERWNTYAHIYAEGSLTDPLPPFMWCGKVHPSTPPLQQIKLRIEGYGFTMLTRFKDLDSLQFLKNDVVNLAHYLRSDAKVLIIGSGGGRDILSALVFNQSFVVGVELNEDILEALTDRFANFTGNLHEHPKVDLISSEGRTFLSSHDDTYDLIQLINVHTWAATSAGAYTLSENSLYTLEAWDLFLDRLNDRGIITLSMWYIRDNPGEVYRMVSLASEALRRKGVEDPLRHILVANCSVSGRGLAAMSVSNDPFSDSDIDRFHKKANELSFAVDFSPRNDGNDLGQIIRKNFSSALGWDYPLNIEPPTDDTPYFFNLLSIRDIFRWQPWIDSQRKYRRFLDFNLEAVFVLILLLGVVILLTGMCIFVPLIVSNRGGVSFSSGLYFASIGLGFMLIEVAQIQRLLLFLGHPTYSLSVVLFSLLLSGGIGSYLSRNAHGAGNLFFGMIGVLLVMGFFTPLVISHFAGVEIRVKILLSIGIMSCLGLFMGMAFPFGVRLSSDRSLLPWYWGINGATSVVGSILAIIIAMTYGISKAYWTGVGCYVIAVLCYHIGMQKTKS